MHLCSSHPFQECRETLLVSLTLAKGGGGAVLTGENLCPGICLLMSRVLIDDTFSTLLLPGLPVSMHFAWEGPTTHILKKIL